MVNETRAEKNLELHYKLDSLPQKIKDKFITEIKSGFVNPVEKRKFLPYLKGDQAVPRYSNSPVQGLEQAIFNYFDGKGVKFPDPSAFRRSLYNGINKEPLKRVYYGILTDAVEAFSDAPWKIDLPKEALQPIVDLVPGNGISLAYLTAGRWAAKDDREIWNLGPEFSDDLLVISKNHILAGLKCLVKTHNRNYAEEKYKNPITELDLPYAKEINKFFSSIIPSKIMKNIEAGKDSLIYK